MQQPYHIPALLTQTIDCLDIKPGGVYVDATFGGGGHSHAIVQLLDAEQGGHLYCFDQDADAIKNAFADTRLTMVYSNFRFLANWMRYYRVDGVDGILADLGVSFHHFDQAERGFSFRADAPLDMRMNQSAPLTAAKAVNEWSEQRLADTLYLYGELRQARRMAHAIVTARQQEPIQTTGALAAVLAPYINAKQEKKELAQAFQALRIAVNGEIEALQQFLQQSLRVLKPGGRLAILTYHSLEDRLVKNFMKTGNIEGRAEADEIYGRVSSPFKLLQSKPIVADAAEVERNPRSRSAKLRVAVKN